jgi:hypothetical protein
MLVNVQIEAEILKTYTRADLFDKQVLILLYEVGRDECGVIGV